MLLDTSGLFCYHHKDELQHEEALRLFDGASAKLTHSYVLAELIPLCQARKLNRVDALMFAQDLVDNPLVEVVWVGEALHTTAFALLQDRLDKTYSMCDAVSFVLMRERGINEALTTDRHFEQEGFTRLLKP
jgi:predicted nucleic acid-binding protein